MKYVLIIAILVLLGNVVGCEKKSTTGFCFDKCTFIDPENMDDSFYIEHFCSLPDCPRCSVAGKQDPNAIHLLLKVKRTQE